jgi:hypothetical protein
MEYNSNMIEIRNYSYDEMKKDISLLIGKYPFLRREVIGKSVELRDIYALTIKGTVNERIVINASHEVINYA